MNYHRRCRNVIFILAIISIGEYGLSTVQVYFKDTQAQCATDTENVDKRDCLPWIDNNGEEDCLARGCKWCTDVPQGVPYCYYNDDVCPSSIPVQDRIDCYPETGASEASCLARGCIWCPGDLGTFWCFEDPETNMGGETCNTVIPDDERIDCFPSDDATKENCLNKGCYWCEDTPGVPFCFTPREHGYYLEGTVIETMKGYEGILNRRNYPTWYGADINQIKFEVEFQENHRLRVKISDPNNNRYEVSENVVNIPSPDVKAADPLYDVVFISEPNFAFQVVRKATGEILFDTTIGGLQFADQFLQIAAKLPSQNLYGFGETEHRTLKHAMNWESWGMWARDQPVDVYYNGYGVHPYFNVLDSGNDMLGVLILNSNAQEVQMIPSGIVYRTIGGVLDMYFFLGPEPEQVSQQYMQAIGNPVMPTYWSLGFHLSRYGYNTLETMKNVVQQMRDCDMPHDSQHGDIDYFERYLDFTYDQSTWDGLPEFVEQLHQDGTRFLTILDPCISIGEPAGTYPPYDRGNDLDVWTKESDEVTNAESVVWPEDNVYFPDYWADKSREWWIQECIDFYNIVPYDGIWLDMNEPASFEAGSVKGCYNNGLNHPPFKPRSVRSDDGDGTGLQDKTLCPDYLSSIGNHYNTHNLYGPGQAEPTLIATQTVTNSRGFAVSRSTFPGTGKYAGHWLGDNFSGYEDMKYSIIGSLEFNLFGIPFVGPDICGYFGDATDHLCQRWMQVGAFFTFSRNHNGLNGVEQNPCAFGEEVAASSRKALYVRYTLLPYLYTLFHQVHVRGGTVMRPLVNEFPKEVDSHYIDEQFLWGGAILITPVLVEGATSVRGYVPAGRWYDYYTGSELEVGADFTIFDAPLDHIPVHVRGGHIIPTQEPANTTVISRTKGMGLIVALDENLSAYGTLFWDDGVSLDTYRNGDYLSANYSCVDNELIGVVTFDGFETNNSIETIRVLGIQDTVASVTIQSVDHIDWTQDLVSRELLITNSNLAITADFVVQWS